MYAEIILPLPLRTVLTYRIPEGMKVEPGMRAEVPLGKGKRYKGMVRRTFSKDPGIKNLRDVLSVPDPSPIVGEQQLRFWQWLADYYMCTLGEVCRTALPRGLKESWSPKLVTHCALSSNFQSEDALNEVMDGLARAPKQLQILQQLVGMLIEGDGLGGSVPRSDLSSRMDFSASAYRGILKKGILTEFQERTERMPGKPEETVPLKKLTGSQQTVLHQIRNLFADKSVVLLKGVTSSGKTEIYMHLIKEMLDKGKQVLYLLPEIALTGQVIQRLRKVFAEEVGIYHSRYSDAERVETFLRARQNPVGKEYGIILGARSALFLPFRDLGLVIVDEEYEHTYKQADPAPRYHARDAAIVLANLHKAQVLLGSATPSLESYYNARLGKFGLVELEERYGRIQQPEIILADLREAYRKKRMISHFTPKLYDLIKQTLEEERQVILFQNRRGFSPYIECLDCGWVPCCPHCDVSLVYHKQVNSLVCHYCGYSEKIPHQCPDCGGGKLLTRGFGTERLEEELEVLFPEIPLARMDLDSTGSRRKYEKILRDFESGNTRILVGTQIVTKGLDFDHVGLVGVLHADNLINFPDFRSYERSYQLISQVAGRAGRKTRRGKVVIQTSSPGHPLMRYILENDYQAMYLDQMEDRKAFHYPPYYRLLRITLRHTRRDILEKASRELAGKLRKALKPPPSATSRTESGSGPFGDPGPVDSVGNASVQGLFSDDAKPVPPAPEILGPQFPPVSRVHRLYLMTILVKVPRTPEAAKHKDLAGELIEEIKTDKRYGKLFIVPDVDPY